MNNKKVFKNILSSIIQFLLFFMLAHLQEKERKIITLAFVIMKKTIFILRLLLYFIYY